jgi:hypothetical protein
LSIHLNGAPLGYDTKDRQITVNEPEAETVRTIFRRYLDLGSLTLLMADLRQRGIVTKQRTLKTGKAVGAIPFSRGPLAHLLRNRFYIGEVKFKGEILPGEQPAILERELFEAVQAKLTEQSNSHTTTRMQSEALLVGRLFDDRGNRTGPKLTDCCADGFEGAGGGFAQEMLELGEDLFNGVQVGRVFRQEEQLGAGCANELAHGSAFVAAEIVHDDDFTGSQGGNENLLDVSSEGLAVDRAIKDPWSVDPVVPQSGQEGRGLPVAVRDFGGEPHAARGPASQRRHVGLGPGFVDEDQTFRLDLVPILGPLRPPARDVVTVALASHHGFFLKLSFSVWTKFQTVR